jgi:mono/diheme cytochrome c family protein
MTVSEIDAQGIADYFEQHLIDPRVAIGTFDLSTFSAMEAEFGRKAYHEHACIGCHQIEEQGKVSGGPQSASLIKAGRRYKVDWLYRFGMNPQDFNPHSGEFLADASGLGLRYVIGFVAIQGLPEFRFAEPWKSEEFGRASVDRGRQIYKEYCMQCHGATGRGDGPAASGLNPKPAIHANMAFEKLPPDYVYNVIYSGGRSLGKSACRRWRGRPRPACACNRGRRSLRQSNTCKQTIPYRLRRRPWNLGRRSS